jgi:zinc/manganese transport system permease protein
MRAGGVMALLSLLHEVLIAPFTDFAFMRRALVGGLAVALGATPIGVFLMLRRMSLMGDAMGHAILPGAALGYFFGGLTLSYITLGGLVAGFGVALAAGLVSRSTLVKEDMALAIFYLLSLGTGVTLVSLNGSPVDVLALLFGSILALDDATLLLIGSVSTLSILLLAIGYRGLVMECLDPGFTNDTSRLGGLFHLGFLALVVLNLVAGFHALGTLLVVGIMIIPAGIARLWRDEVGGMIGVAMLCGSAGTLIGLLFSYHSGAPSGPAIILVLGGMYLLSILVAPHGVLPRLLPRKHLRG